MKKASFVTVQSDLNFFTKRESSITYTTKCHQWLFPSSSNTKIFLVFLGLHLRHMEVPRIGVQSELLPPAYTTATATPDQRLIHNLFCSLRQCGILNPLNEAWDATGVLMDTSWVLYPLSHHGNSQHSDFNFLLYFSSKKKMPAMNIYSFYIEKHKCFSSFFLFGHAHGMWKFPGQGSNLHHSSNPSCFSDNARPLALCITRWLHKCFNFFS